MKARLTLLIIFLILSACLAPTATLSLNLSFSQSGQRATDRVGDRVGDRTDHDVHNPKLECPKVRLRALPNRYSLILRPFGLTTQKVRLNFFWSDNEPNPQINLGAPLYNESIGEIYRYYRNDFGWRSLPRTVNIVETRLAAGIGGLYCPQYQTDPLDAVTIFMSPETLDSTPEFTRLLAHELTHHWFYVHHKLATAATWIEEGVAYLSEYVVTGAYSGTPVIEYLHHPATSLTQTNSRAYIPQMGEVQLLFSYLYNRLGDSFLRRLLATKMTNTTDMDAAIPPRNALQWRSFQDAFRDFQIAKFVNREDYLAATAASRERYFLFPTTIKASLHATTNLTAWSAIEYRSGEKMCQADHEFYGRYEYQDLIVSDNPAHSITYRQLNKCSAQRTNLRFIRVVFNPVAPRNHARTQVN